MHPFVIGEIALGSIKDRDRIIAEMREIDPADIAEHDEVMTLIETRALHGLGIGYVDVHLLASALITPDTWLWTRDKRLEAAATELGVAARPVN